MTAQRRTERLQDVPIAVNVVSSDTLSANNFNSLNDLQQISPALVYNESGASFQIRGIGTITQNGSAEQDVAVVVDDVVQGITEINHSYPYYNALSDIDRVEVLEGPQGTLFGKNSSAGVVNIITKRPVLNKFEDDASASYGSRNEIKLSDVVNIPLGDTVAVRAEAYQNQQDGIGYDGYRKHSIDSYIQNGLGVKLLWRPNDKFTAYLNLEDRFNRTNDGGAAAVRTCGTGPTCADDRPYGVVPSKTNTTLADDGATLGKTAKIGASLHLEYELPNGDTLTSITAWFHLYELSDYDIDETPTRYLSDFFEPFEAHEVTQEFRLSSPASRFLEYTVGFFYYNTSEVQNVNIYGTLGLEPNNSRNLLGIFGPGNFLSGADSTSLAGYGQGTLHINDHLRLIGGMRVTHDDVSGTQQLVYAGPGVCQITYAFGASCIPATYGVTTGGIIPPTTPFSFPSIPSTGDITATNVSGKVGVQYDVTRDLMAYATFSTGYKGPAVGFNPSEAIGSAFAPVKPETSTDYEIGVKSQWLHHRLTFNADAFYTKYENFQASYYSYANNPLVGDAVYGNAGGLQTKGVEAQVSFALTPEFTVSASGAYIPTKFTNYAIPCTTSATLTNPSTPGGPTSAPCYSSTGRPPFTAFNAAGYPLEDAPKVVYNISGDYHHNMFSDMLVTGHVNWNHRSSEYLAVVDPNTIQAGYGILDASLGYGARDGMWRVSIFGRNLLNQFYVDNLVPTTGDTGGAHPTQGYSQVFGNDAKRTIGIKLEAKFR